MKIFIRNAIYALLSFVIVFTLAAFRAKTLDLHLTGWEQAGNLVWVVILFALMDYAFGSRPESAPQP